MQVVTSENFQQLVETGKVDEFKPPEAKAEAKVEAKDDKPRDETGKFVKEEAEVTADKEAAKPAEDEDQEDKDLPERVRKQIGKKHRAMKEAEETARKWWADKTAAEERAERAERELQSLKSGSAKTKDLEEPKVEDFKNVAEYTDALVEYKFQKREREQEQRRINEAQERSKAEFIDRLNATRKEIPDFDEVTGDADIDVVPHVAAYIAESALGPKLGYHFAKNPDELERIQKLSPIRAIAELGKLEDKLEKPKAEPAKEKTAEKTPAVSKAPSPISTLASEGKTVVQKDPSKMSFQELREYERNKERERARR